MTDVAPPPVQFVASNAPPRADDRDACQHLDVITELGWQTHIAWEKIIGEEIKPNWEELSDEERDALRASVRWLIEHPTSSIAQQHDAWRAHMAGAGMELGNRDDTHNPNLQPFDSLPFSQQMKARLWRHIIFAVFG